MARSVLPHSKLKARRQRRRVQIALLVVGVTFVATGTIVALLHLPHLRITSITVLGGKSVAPEVLAAAAKAVLDGTYFSILPKNNILIYPERSLIESLKKEFPLLSELEVRRESMRALVVRVSEYEPYALWCGASPSAVEPCLLIDKGGVAYTKAVTPDSVYVRYYGVLGGEGLPRQYIEKKDFQKLTALLNEVERTLSPDTLVRVYVDEYNDARAVFKSGFVLVFTLKDESVDVLERFALGLTAEPFNEHVVSEFEYLDLRFGDKLYYKLKVSP